MTGDVGGTPQASEGVPGKQVHIVPPTERLAVLHLEERINQRSEKVEE